MEIKEIKLDINELKGKLITTIPQSKKLIELGISPCSASLFLTKDVITLDYKLVSRLFANGKSIPIWTLDDLIHMLPDNIEWCMIPPISDIYTRYVCSIDGKTIIYRCEHDGKIRICIETEKGESLLNLLIYFIEILKMHKLDGLLKMIKND